MDIWFLIIEIAALLGLAFALGAIIALSSTAIVLRVLMDRMEIDAIHRRNALAIVLTQDTAVLPLVLLVTIMGHGSDLHNTGLHIVWTLVSAGGLAAVFYLLFYIVIPKALMTRGLFNNRELVVLLTIAIGAGSAWSAHAVGLSPALGAFIADMLLAESSFATQIRSDIVSLRTLFVAPYLAAYAVPLAERLMGLFRKQAPPLPIASPHLRAAGAPLVVDEENTIGDELAREVVAS